MRAAEAWVALCRAGVTLEDEGGGLALRVPPGVEPGAWLALGRAFGAHLYPLASGAWRAEVEGWPAWIRDEWDERAALRALDDGLTCDEAERAAFLEVRERALAPHSATLDALGRELGAVLLQIEARPSDGGLPEDAIRSSASRDLAPQVRRPSLRSTAAGGLRLVASAGRRTSSLRGR